MRASRANPAQPVIDIARIRLGKLGPSRPTMANASTWEGRPSMMSINRLMTASTTPPLNAAPTPASIPNG